MRSLLVFVALIFFFTCFAQNKSVSLQLKDENTGNPIRNVTATILIDDSIIYKNSNRIGEIHLLIENENKVEVSFSHPKYISEDLVIKWKTIDADSLRQVVLLSPDKIQYVNEVVVKPKGEPYVVYGSKRVSVADFAVLEDGKLLLLTYLKRLKKGSELQLFDGKKALQKFNVPGIAKNLVQDFRRNTHLVCAENVFSVITDENNFSIAKIEKDYFQRYILPIVDSNASQFFFSNYNKDYPSFDYFSYNQKDSAYTKIASITDDLMLELYRSEYKWMDIRTKLWAKNKELQTGVDKEVWVGANYFTESIYYKSLYAPLFHRNDSIFVFDYYKDELSIYNLEAEKIDSVSIYHHYKPRKTGWSENLIQDFVTGEIYAQYEKDGISYIGSVDVRTGEIRQKIELSFKYVENIQVHNNFVYYIYREFATPQKKFLYKEQLPYKI